MLNYKTDAKKHRNPYAAGMKEFIEEKLPHLKQAFLEQLPAAEEAILYKWAESLLREDVLQLRSGAIEWEQKLPGREKGALFLSVPLRDRANLIFSCSGRHAFNRFMISELFLLKDGLKKIHSCRELLDVLESSHPSFSEFEGNWESYADELMNGSANLALTYAVYEERRKHLPENQNLLEYALGLENPFLFFEQLCIEGHHLHPGTKTKMGMEPEEVYRFSPELNGKVSISFMLGKKSAFLWKVKDGEDPNECMYSGLPGLKDKAEAYCCASGLDLNEWLLIPVHPWQLKHIVPGLFADELENDILIPADLEWECFPTTSFRTVVPKGNDWFLKLPVHSQMTSTKRSVSAQTALNGPVVSELLMEIVEKEPQLKDTFIPVPEIYGAALKSENPLKSRNMTAMVRSGLKELLGEGEIPVTASSYNSRSPFTERLILEDLFAAFCEKHSLSLKEGFQPFIKSYISIVLPGTLTLMTKYGIGLEGHMQNSIAVFKDGKPVKYLFRDWGGARIYRKRLESQGFEPEFMPGSVSLTDSLDEMRRKMHYTAYQSHFGEVFRILSVFTGCSEEIPWKWLAEETNMILSTIGGSNAEEDREFLFSRAVKHKALSSMRLFPDRDGYVYADAPNPLNLDWTVG
ncbi:hypothetical protein GKZ89_14775 [Bacillus mangrovi]|uniref:IucA/IucC family siderophore biosynthesis protein n=1 Tax=Metabacillus mangrovi TaxID=1491830 RepID=A0A7X2S724_9BACI|nr:IucA/IucC family protein [Metabacillus mangrovi]MTH54665.1 hypothetical protein [Metabacillus mangrovi]